MVGHHVVYNSIFGELYFINGSPLPLKGSHQELKISQPKMGTVAICRILLFNV